MLADGIRTQTPVVRGAIGDMVDGRIGSVGLTVPTGATPTPHRDGWGGGPGPRNTGVTGGTEIDYDRLARALAGVSIRLDGRQVSQAVDERLGMVLL
jgi:hypothetical protein